MLFSVVVPAYNSEKTISKCLDSLVLQDFRDFQVIVIDDGSTDNTVDIIKKYQNSLNLLLIKSKNGGVSKARNIGISNSTAQFIIFLDSDDSFESTLLGTLEQLIRSKNVDLIIWNYKKIIIDNQNIEYLTNIITSNFSGIQSMDLFQIIKLYNDNLLNVPWNKCYELKKLNELNLKFDEKTQLGEDFKFNLHYLLNINSYIVLHEPFSNYFINQEQRRKQFFVEDILPSQIEIINQFYSLSKEKGMFYKLSSQLDTYYISVIFSALKQGETLNNQYLKRVFLKLRLIPKSILLIKTNIFIVLLKIYYFFRK